MGPYILIVSLFTNNNKTLCSLLRYRSILYSCFIFQYNLLNNRIKKNNCESVSVMCTATSIPSSFASVFFLLSNDRNVQMIWRKCIGIGWIYWTLASLLQLVGPVLHWFHGICDFLNGAIWCWEGHSRSIPEISRCYYFEVTHFLITFFFFLKIAWIFLLKHKKNEFAIFSEWKKNFCWNIFQTLRKTVDN